MGIKTASEYRDGIEQFGLVRARRAKELLARAKHLGSGPEADAATEKAREIAKQVDAAAKGKILLSWSIAADHEWAFDHSGIPGLLSFAVEHGLVDETD